ncbi:long-chain-fatty-acid-CoA ligase [Auriculariales sp. MPI-PUGE-AT-0066]|nr:long-chain-fatty-acid-CoA ligase [Auriculariales sp. MPI-PUGE-AT-0066]
MVFEIINTPANFDIKTQSKELPGTKRPGQTAVYTSQAWPQEHPIDYGVYTLGDAFESGMSRGAQRECLGHRPIIPHSNPIQRERRYVWQTYGEVDQRRRDLGSALYAMFQQKKIGGGELPTVGIWSTNVPEWQIVDLTAQLYGFVSVALYDTLGPDAVEYVINHSETTIAFATAVHLPSLLKLAGEKCPKLKAIVSIDPLEPQARQALQAWATEKHVDLFAFTELEAIGRKNRIEPPNVTPDQIASICYTSGTTANPKGAILTHRNILAGVAMMLHGADLDPNKVTVISFLPLAHIYGRIIELLAISAGGRIGYFGGDTLQLMDDIQILKPDYMPSVPRVLNKIYAGIMAQTKAPGLKGALLRQAIKSKLENYRATGNTDHAFWDRVVFRKVRALTGGNLVGITSGSAPLSPEVFDLIKIAFGGKVVEGYGMTETNATITRTVVHDPTGSGLAGFPHAFTQIKLVDVPDMGYTAEDKPFPRGEICVKSDACITSYYKDPENTKKLIDADGWLHTGDVGLIDECTRLRIIDRVKNIMKLAQGEYIGLERIENAYTSCPLIQQVYVYATSLREYTVGLVVPEYAPFAGLAERVTGEKVDPADRAALERAAKDPRVVEALLRALDKEARKAGLKGFEQVKNIHIELEPFSVDNGLMTPTFKARRQQVDLKYKDAFEALYAHGPIARAAKAKL